ncbi:MULTISPECIES: hypothetical protein [unclassified Microbacterium]|uniref:hypothetical protein n=1 Tax=unclassified Microbacterium TaxID=2609290 RepID=UPI0036652B58
MVLILASPVVAPIDDVPQASAREMTWTGWDGSVWRLTGRAATIPRLMPGVKGLHFPPMSVFTSGTPLVPGVDLMGYSAQGRPVFWPLLFRAPSVDVWAEQYAAFFDSFHPVKPGVWRVGSGTDARELELTGTFDGSIPFEHDPFMTGLAKIGLELFAARPLWRGEPIRETFGAEGTNPPFIDPATLGPPFHISATGTVTTAQITNPGDEPAYLRWTANGTGDSLLMGVGEAIIDVPFAVPDGSVLIVDTDPRATLATLDGVDVTRELGFQMFAPVPAKGTTDLTILVDSGSVTAEIIPQYWRAF